MPRHVGASFWHRSTCTHISRSYRPLDLDVVTHSAIRFRGTTALSVQRARAARTKDHTPDMRTRSARLVCILTIFTDFRRHRRAGGGVVGIDGPPPSRRALSLSLSPSFLPVYSSRPVCHRLFLPFSLRSFSCALARNDRPGFSLSLCFSYVFTYDSAIPRFRDATCGNARSLARFHADYSAASGHSHARKVVSSLRAYARVLRSHAVDYTRALAHCTPPRRAAHARSRVRDQVRASDRAHIRGFAHSPPPPPPPPPPLPRLALAPCIIRVHPSLAPPLRPQPLTEWTRKTVRFYSHALGARARTSTAHTSAATRSRTYLHLHTQRDTAPLCVRVRVRLQLCLTTSRAGPAEMCP